MIHDFTIVPGCLTWDIDFLYSLDNYCLGGILVIFSPRVHTTT